MKFLLEYSTRYLMIKHSERVRYRVDHEKRHFTTQRTHVLFCLLHKLTTLL